jgi:hypothetical protein
MSNTLIAKMNAAREEARIEEGDTLADFKMWYYMYVVCEDSDTGVLKEEVEDGLKDYEVQELSDFIDNYLDNNNYSNQQKRFFDCAEFCNALMDEDGYEIYWKPKATKEFSGFEESGDLYNETVHMTTEWDIRDERVSTCRTTVNYYIIKQN